MRSGADVSPPFGQRPAKSRTTLDTLAFWRRPNPALKHDEAVLSWGFARRDHASPPRRTSQSFAASVTVHTQSDTACPLLSLLDSTTLVFYIGQSLALTPGLPQRLHRRAATLGPGVRLITVTAAEAPPMADAYIDRDGAFSRIHGALLPPALISIDAEGHIFDLQYDADALLDWIWNDPRPRSRRA